MRNIPILQGHGSVIPYDLVKQHERQVMINHGGQTVEKISNRGGLDWVELYCVLNDKPFDNMILPELAMNGVLKKIDEFYKIHGCGYADPNEKKKEEMKFELGKYYKHTTGNKLHICGLGETYYHGRCFIGENEYGELKPVGSDESSAVNFIEISKEQFSNI